jgi:hypothetical protein
MRAIEMARDQERLKSPLSWRPNFAPARSNTDVGAQRRIRNAGFPKMKTFDTFDWQFQKGLNVQLVKDLMNLHFVKQGRPLLLLGRPGTGKSHLSTAYGVLAATAGYSVRFVTVSRLLRDLYATLVDGSTDRLWPSSRRPQTPSRDPWLPALHLPEVLLPALHLRVTPGSAANRNPGTPQPADRIQVRPAQGSRTGRR